MLGNKTY
ncbi:hypothetical protein AYI70_g7743, partial [Smittium culicis]